MVQLTETIIPVWDDLSEVTRAGVLTIMFFFAPAMAATGFSEDMVVRFFQTLGLTAVLAFGFLLRHDFEKSRDMASKSGTDEGERQ